MAMAAVPSMVPYFQNDCLQGFCKYMLKEESLSDACKRFLPDMRPTAEWLTNAKTFLKETLAIQVHKNTLLLSDKKGDFLLAGMDTLPGSSRVDKHLETLYNGYHRYYKHMYTCCPHLAVLPEQYFRGDFSRNQTNVYSYGPSKAADAIAARMFWTMYDNCPTTAYECLKLPQPFYEAEIQTIRTAMSSVAENDPIDEGRFKAMMKTYLGVLFNTFVICARENIDNLEFSWNKIMAIAKARDEEARMKRDESWLPQSEEAKKRFRRFRRYMSDSYFLDKALRLTNKAAVRQPPLRAELENILNKTKYGHPYMWDPRVQHAYIRFATSNEHPVYFFHRGLETEPRRSSLGPALDMACINSFSLFMADRVNFECAYSVCQAPMPLDPDCERILAMLVKPRGVFSEPPAIHPNILHTLFIIYNRFVEFHDACMHPDHVPKYNRITPAHVFSTPMVEKEVLFAIPSKAHEQLYCLQFSKNLSNDETLRAAYFFAREPEPEAKVWNLIRKSLASVAAGNNQFHTSHAMSFPLTRHVFNAYAKFMTTYTARVHKEDQFTGLLPCHVFCLPMQEILMDTELLANTKYLAYSLALALSSQKSHGTKKPFKRLKAMWKAEGGMASFTPLLARTKTNAQYALPYTESLKDTEYKAIRRLLKRALKGEDDNAPILVLFGIIAEALSLVRRITVSEELTHAAELTLLNFALKLLLPPDDDDDAASAGKRTRVLDLDLVSVAKIPRLLPPSSSQGAQKREGAGSGKPSHHQHGGVNGGGALQSPGKPKTGASLYLDHSARGAPSKR